MLCITDQKRLYGFPTPRVLRRLESTRPGTPIGDDEHKVFDQYA